VHVGNIEARLDQRGPSRNAGRVTRARDRAWRIATLTRAYGAFLPHSVAVDAEVNRNYLSRFTPCPRRGPGFVAHPTTAKGRRRPALRRGDPLITRLISPAGGWQGPGDSTPVVVKGTPRNTLSPSDPLRFGRRLPPCRAGSRRALLLNPPARPSRSAPPSAGMI